MNVESCYPKQLAERMENKMHRHVHYTYATYLCTLLDFVTRNGIEAGDKDSRYIVFNPELLAQKRGQYCEIPEKLNEMKNESLLPNER